ncbi:hypothetical protein [Parabacteroides goldsteinii]|uniref:hypothetical protein n=1 Tax=Parabacteroides goldsteinii TaxID=328812 RepID=UPI00101D7107|nr:hypothetical protein [Parabacteroides goldsteinii]
MKKTLFLLALACCLPTAGHSQGFMKKLKQKVENAVGISESTDIAEDQTQADDNHDGNSDGNKPIQRPTPSDKLQKLRTATATWDEAVTPSKASSIEALLKELPPLPSVDEMANPNAAARETYYRKIVAVTTRVRELDKQYTCSNEEMIAFRENMYASTAKKLGITEAELRALENDMTSEAEKERITQKIVSNTIGDMSSLEAMAVDIEKREAAAGGELSDQDRLAILAELMQKQIDGPPNPLINYNKILGKNADIIKSLYARLCNTDDPAEIEQIYTEADELAKRARREAAVTWRKYLAEQIELNKGLYPQSMSLQADMVKAGMIPACAEKRASLNIVTICANLLDQAYRDFPEPEFSPVCKETIMKFPKSERMMRAESGYATSVDGFLSGSVIWTIDEENGTEYIYENGKKREMDTKGRQAIKQQQQKREDYDPPYGTWTSQSGKWTATYSRDGALTLHDGSTFYPSALKKEGNRLIWVEVSGENVEKCVYKL